MKEPKEGWYSGKETMFGDKYVFTDDGGTSIEDEYGNLHPTWKTAQKQKRKKAEEERANAVKNQPGTSYDDIYDSGINKMQQEIEETLFSHPGKDLKTIAIIAVIIVAILTGLSIIGSIGSILVTTVLGIPTMVFHYVVTMAEAESIHPISIVQGIIMVFEVVLFIRYAIVTLHGGRKKYALRFALLTGIPHLLIYFVMSADIKGSLFYAYEMTALPVILLCIFKCTSQKKRQSV
ncbi:MAG: hypothetical protein K6G83_13615 [Lachnospiraceae bacterium]|nr:hypothetical protein [Lachnospiraceae bacterium]